MREDRSSRLRFPSGSDVGWVLRWIFARVDRSGKPLWDGLKHPHAVAYAALAFRLTRHLDPPGEGESWALRALTWLDDVAWDTRDGGYWGSYRRNNERYEEGALLPTMDGRATLGLSLGFKEINTQGDVLEALASYVGSTTSDTHADRLDWMVNLITERLIDPYGAMSYAYRQDWRPAPGLVRVGYQFQMARRLAPLSGSHVGNDLIAKSRRLVDFCMRSARHPEGGFCFAVSADGRAWPDTGSSSDLRLWWVQFEALHALQILDHHEAIDGQNRVRYLEACEDQWSFVSGHFLDSRHGGVRQVPLDSAFRGSTDSLRRWSLRRRPSPTRLKSHPWKDPYHEVSTLLAFTRDRRVPLTETK